MPLGGTRIIISMKVRVRFPNDETWHEVDFDWSQWRTERTYLREVCGYYRGHYLMVNRDDYEDR
jgi:hypothetical protein